MILLSATTNCLVVFLLLQIIHDGVSAAWMSSATTRKETTACASPQRRAAVVGGAALLGLVGPPVVVQAQEDDTPLLQVTVTLDPKDIVAPSSTTIPEMSDSALYITARPNTVDNVPRAILDGSRGKAPPVLVARIAHMSLSADAFPLVYTLTARDVTVEGTGDWWRDGALIVSARWDSDGVAATRDPNDRVGRSMVATTTTMTLPQVVVELQGRGAAGKYFTRKK